MKKSSPARSSASVKSSSRSSAAPSWMTSVTPFSKYLAMALFVILPFTAFILGMKYQRGIDTEPQVELCRYASKDGAPKGSPMMDGYRR